VKFSTNWGGLYDLRLQTSRGEKQVQEDQGFSLARYAESDRRKARGRILLEVLGQKTVISDLEGSDQPFSSWRRAAVS